MHEQYDVNEVATLRFEYSDGGSGQAIDPAAIALTITRPDGTTILKAKPDLSSPTVGTWTYDQQLTQNGVWQYKAVSTLPYLTQDGLLIVGTAIHAGPCENWMLPSEIFDCGPCASISDINEGLALDMTTAASEFYYVASGRRFPGLCEATVRPCRRSSLWWYPPSWTWGSYFGGGGFGGADFATAPWGFPAGWGSCGCQATDPSGCTCSGPSSVLLPGPVRGVIDVRVDGAIVSPALYRLDANVNMIVRVDGETWPMAQDLAKDPLVDAGTFQVRYIRGTPPPELGVLAAKELACEFYRGCTGGDCAVPQKVTNLARQGVTMQFVSPEDLGITANGEIKTGLRSGALFLAAYGRGGRRRRRGSIGSPDVGPLVRRTGP